MYYKKLAIVVHVSGCHRCHHQGWCFQRYLVTVDSENRSVCNSGNLNLNLKIKYFHKFIEQTTIIIGLAILLVTLSVVLNGCETWSGTQRQQSRLKVSENRVLRKLFGPRSDMVTGDWKELYKDKLQEFYSSLYINQSDQPCGLVVKVYGY
jgi:hypothetical protein